MLGFTLAIALPLWAGYQAAGLGIRRLERTRARTVLQLALGVGLGLGLTSCLHYLWLCWIGTADLRYCVIESTLLVALAIGCNWLRRNEVVSGPRAAANSDTLRWLPIAFGVLAIGATSALVLGYLDSPYGYGDSWNIWNHRARSFYRLGDDWRMAFTLAGSHSDYPLLLPCTNARLWTYAGRELEWGPMFVAGIYFAALAGIVGGGLALAKSRATGYLAAAVLLGNVAMLQSGISQFAEMPLVFYFAAAAALVALHDSLPRGSIGLLVLAGLMAGFAAWTKNEGMLFVVALLTARATLYLARFRTFALGSEALPLVAGAAVVMTVVVAFKTSMPFENDLVAGQTRAATIQRLLDPERYRLIAVEGSAAALKVLKGFAVVLPAALLLLGRAQPQPGVRSSLPMTVTVVVYMLAGYALVYLTTPHDLVWHLRTSADRLFMQILPLGLWVFFAFFRSPDDFCTSSATSDSTPSKPESGPLLTANYTG